MKLTPHLERFLHFTESLARKKTPATEYQKWLHVIAEKFTVNRKLSISGSRFKRLRRKLWAEQTALEKT
jgi:hypothetical protein